MKNFEILWKEKKARLADKIMHSPNNDILRFAKELAEMELAENGEQRKELCGRCGEYHGPNDSDEEAEMNEFIEITAPVVEFLRKKYNPHTTVIITGCTANILADEMGVPMHEKEEK